MADIEVRLIAFPFGLDATGKVGTVDQASDAWVEQCLALAMLTRPGERIQVPAFGVADPAFSLFQVGALQRHLIDFGPDVTLTDVRETVRTDGREEVSVTWQYNDADAAGDPTGALTA